MTHSVLKVACKDPRITCTHLFDPCEFCRPFLEDWCLVMAHKRHWRVMWNLSGKILQSWTEPLGMRISGGQHRETFVVKFDDVAGFLDNIQNCPDQSLDTWEHAVWEHIRPMSYDLGDNGDEPLF